MAVNGVVPSIVLTDPRTLPELGSKLTSWPWLSVAAQTVPDAHETAVRWKPGSTLCRPAELIAPVTGSNVISLPPLSTAVHCAVEGQETEETVPITSMAVRVAIAPVAGLYVIWSPLPSTVEHWLVIGQLTGFIAPLPPVATSGLGPSQVNESAAAGAATARTTSTARDTHRTAAAFVTCGPSRPGVN